MNIRQLHYFITVAETKSLSRATEQLHIAQPALSQTIKNLEAELGGQLFHRLHRGVELTEAGRALLNHAYPIMRQVDAARNSVRESEENPEGNVSVGLPATISNVITVPVYKMLSERYPKINLNLEEGLTGHLRVAFEAAMFDLTVEFDMEPSKTHKIENLVRENLYLVSRLDADNQGEDEIEFSKLPEFPIGQPLSQHGTARVLEKYARLTGIKLNMAHGTFTFYAALKLIREGLLYGILPWSAVYEDVEKGILSARKVVNPVMERTASLVVPLMRPNTHAMEKVQEVIKIAVVQAHAEGKWHGELLIS